MKIEQGYMVVVTSWENDADNYKTETLSGLNRSEAKFYFEACNLMRSIYRGGKYGNQYIEGYVTGEDSSFVKDLKKLAQNNNLDVFEYAHEDVLDDLIGIWCEGERYRVCESCEVYYNPAEIKLETINF